jgi:hypothetical protein
VSIVTVCVVALTTALLDPAGITTDGGTVSAVELDCNCTVMPPVGATPSSDTVKLTGVPPWTDVGPVIDDKAEGETPTIAVLVLPMYDAVIVDPLFVVTA